MWWKIITFLQGNAFLQRHQPWMLIKHPEEQCWLDTVLHMALECVRLCCVLLYPIVPQSMTELRHRLGLSTDITTQDLQCRLSRTFIKPGSDLIPGASTKLNSCSKPLFKKFDIWFLYCMIMLLFIQVNTIFGFQFVYLVSLQILVDSLECLCGDKWSEQLFSGHHNWPCVAGNKGQPNICYTRWSLISAHRHFWHQKCLHKQCKLFL